MAVRLHARTYVDLSALDRILQRFPEMRSRYLGLISTRTKEMVKSQFLSGQEIMLSKDQDRLGRSMVNYRIAKRGKKARITSIPMNLFERGRMLRSGRKEPGKWVLSRKAPARAQAQLQAWAQEFERVIVSEYTQ